MYEDSGNISCAASGEKVYTLTTPISLLASSKLYYLAFQIDSNTPTITSANAIPLLERPALGGNGPAQYRVAAAYLPFVSPFPSSQVPTTGWGVRIEAFKQ
jgi:hypothetical protein